MNEILSLPLAGWLLRGAVFSIAALALWPLVVRRSAACQVVYWRGIVAGLLVLPAVVMAAASHLPGMWTITFPPIARSAGPAQEVRLNQGFTATAPSVALLGKPERPLLAAPSKISLGNPTTATELRFEQPSASVGKGEIALAPATLWPALSVTRSLTGIWVLGIGLLMARWVHGLFCRGRLLAGAKAIEIGNGIEGVVPGGCRVLLSRHAVQPCAWGTIRPVILLPEASIHWSGEQRRMVLAHEVAHLRRRDPLWQFLSHLALALHWLNPFGWLVHRQLRLASERAADDAVLANNAAAGEYATLLVERAKEYRSSISKVAVVSMAHHSSVAARVQKILAPKQDRRLPSTGHVFLIVSALTVSIVGAMIVVPVAASAQEPNANPGAAAAAEQTTPTKRTTSASDEQEIKTGPSEFDNERKNNADSPNENSDKQPKTNVSPPNADRRKGPQIIRGVGVNAETVLQDKLYSIVVPSMVLDKVTVEEAVEFLRVASRERDPAKKGVNFILRLAQGELPKITVNLTDVPLGVAIHTVAVLAGLQSRVEPHAVIIASPGSNNELYTRVFRVPPDFLSYARTENEKEGQPTRRANAEDVLKQAGIPFPEGASAFFNGVISTLTVRNTSSNLDLVAQLVETMANKLARFVIARVELYRMPKKSALELIAEVEGKGDASKAADDLRRHAGADEIELVAAPIVTTRSGQRATISVGGAHSTASKPADAPSPSGAAEEKRDRSGEGTHFVIDPTLGPDGFTIDFSIELEHRSRGKSTALADAPTAASGVPGLTVSTLTTASTTWTGQTRFLGALSSPGSDDTLTLAFIKVTATALND